MNSTTKATIRQCTQPDTLYRVYRVFVGNWAFPCFDFGFHSAKTARRIKQLYDQGDMRAAIEEAEANG